MSEQASVNYPDILGAITGGPRLNLDVIQCALAVRPPQIAAGRSFEMVLLLQNASDVDVDVVVAPELPAFDAAKQKDRFLTKNTRLRIGLRPAEAGFLSLPISTSSKTAPGSGYGVGLILEIKRMGKHVQRVREGEGGGGFMIQELGQEAQGHVEALRMLHFSFDPGGKKQHIQAPFEMLPPALSALKEIKADWVSLWSMRDYMDEYTIAQKVWPQVQSVREQLVRQNVFMPLLKTTQARFQTGRYPLHAPEAIYITKLLTLILEMAVSDPMPLDPRPAWPRWFVKLCRLIFQEPALATQIEPLATHLLFADLMHDAMMYGFTMISTVTNEDFGTHDEISRYCDDIVLTLMQDKPLDFARAYFPLVLGGLIANTRVTMPKEQVRETVFILSKALDIRRSEKNEDNAFIFEIADQLIERALDTI